VQHAADVKQVSPPKVTSRFATKTLFDALADVDGHEEQNGDTVIIGSSFALNPNARPFPIVSVAVDGASDGAVLEASSPRKGAKKPKVSELKIDAIMPPFNTDFWRVYANKLRVFGTAEGLLDLDPARMA
jgi:poly(A)-specific ribonuclease